jgi:hypothetical protein
MKVRAWRYSNLGQCPAGADYPMRDVMVLSNGARCPAKATLSEHQLISLIFKDHFWPIYRLLC